MKQEIVGFWDGSGISWTICKQPATHSRQITTPTPHFYRPDSCSRQTNGVKALKVLAEV